MSMLGLVVNDLGHLQQTRAKQEQERQRLEQEAADAATEQTQRKAATKRAVSAANKAKIAEVGKNTPAGGFIELLAEFPKECGIHVKHSTGVQNYGDGSHYIEVRVSISFAPLMPPTSPASLEQAKKVRLYSDKGHSPKEMHDYWPVKVRSSAQIKSWRKTGDESLIDDVGKPAATFCDIDVASCTYYGGDIVSRVANSTLTWDGLERYPGHNVEGDLHGSRIWGPGLAEIFEQLQLAAKRHMTPKQYALFTTTIEQSQNGPASPPHTEWKPRPTTKEFG